LCAGIQPAEDIDPLALHFMAQQGIDIKYRLPQALDTLMDEEFTNNLPVCAVCLEPDITPIPGVKTVYWDLPEAADAEGAALVGKQIQARVEDLVSGLKQDMAANR
jgi:protein-tyrosine-phosphatase